MALKPHIAWVAAHLRTFLKECGSFAHTISPGKRFHLRTQFPQVNVTFAHIKFSPVNGMFALVGLYRQAKWNILKQILEREEFYMKVLDSEKKEKVRRYTCGDA